MRDTLPVLYETKVSARNKMSDEIKKWGYQFIETPALEYYETIGDASAILDQQLFKLLDSQAYARTPSRDDSSHCTRRSIQTVKTANSASAWPIPRMYTAHSSVKEAGRQNSNRLGLNASEISL